MMNYILTKTSKALFGLKTFLKPAIRLISNKKIRALINLINGRFSNYAYKKSILQYFKTLDGQQITNEQGEVLRYLEKNPATLFPYSFIENYKPSDIEVFYDKIKNLKYVLLDNKKMYFKRGSDDAVIQSLFSTLLLVQDPQSPHRYLNNDFNVTSDDIVADVGSAEGDFSLSIVDKVKKLYIFEPDQELVEALEATFEPWKDKVVIINKYVGKKVAGDFTTLDEFIKNNECPTFIKVDVEGAENDLIEGAVGLLKNKELCRVVMATYHRYNDEVVLGDALSSFGFNVEFSNGYMLSIWDDVLKPPYLRRALARAIKSK